MSDAPRPDRMGKAIIASVVVAVIVFLNVRAPKPDAPAATKVSEFDQIWMGKQAILARLRDPKSAEFSDVRLGPVLAERTGGGAVCGYVNSKNGFGGYSGRQRFIAAGDLAYLESEVADGFDPIWGRLCGQ
jgi:hypothetical protein